MYCRLKTKKPPLPGKSGLAIEKGENYALDNRRFAFGSVASRFQFQRWRKPDPLTTSCGLSGVRLQLDRRAPRGLARYLLHTSRAADPFHRGLELLVRSNLRRHVQQHREIARRFQP